MVGFGRFQPPKFLPISAYVSLYIYNDYLSFLMGCAVVIFLSTSRSVPIASLFVHHRRDGYAISDGNKMFRPLVAAPYGRIFFVFVQKKIRSFQSKITPFQIDLRVITPMIKMKVDNIFQGHHDSFISLFSIFSSARSIPTIFYHIQTTVSSKNQKKKKKINPSDALENVVYFNFYDRCYYTKLI